MAYFTPAFHEFFIELAANNHKDWFHANKKRYERDVKKPFDKFVQDVLDALAAEGQTIDIKAKDAIFRVNRDIRFSKDKSPYKLQRSAICSRYGRKDKSYPGGIYIDFGPEKVWIGGGAYFLDKDQLYDLRDHIAKKSDQFLEAIHDRDFVATYGEVHGEKNKIVPKEFKPVLEKVPEIANKQMYYMSEHAPETIFEDNLLETTLAHWRAARKLEQFLVAGIVR